MAPWVLVQHCFHCSNAAHSLGRPTVHDTHTHTHIPFSTASLADRPVLDIGASGFVSLVSPRA